MQPTVGMFSQQILHGYVCNRAEPQGMHVTKPGLPAKNSCISSDQHNKGNRSEPGLRHKHLVASMTFTAAGQARYTGTWGTWHMCLVLDLLDIPTAGPQQPPERSPARQRRQRRPALRQRLGCPSAAPLQLQRLPAPDPCSHSGVIM